MTALDVLSAGRAVVVFGTGYVRSEFAALGADFAKRNARFDEATEVLLDLWSSPEKFCFEGSDFSALGVALSPGPVQRPHPPLWIGGNAAVTRRRVAGWADGWTPLVRTGGASDAGALRTATISSTGQLGAHIAQIKQLTADLGRDPDRLDVACPGLVEPTSEATAGEWLDYLDVLRTLGVTWAPLPLVTHSFAAALESVEPFGREVIAPLR